MLLWHQVGTDRHWTGRFAGFDKKGRLVIKSPKGKNVALSPDKLAPGALAYAKLLQAQTGGNPSGPDASPDGAEASSPVEEDWHSNDGKTIKATFVSLENGKITLRNSDGKQFTFALERLSEGSQTRARELAAQPANPDG